MTEQTQNGSQDSGISPDAGTTDNGQSVGGQPNDPNAFQADYTQKYQALSEERKAFEAERTAFEQQKNSYTQQPANQGYSQQAYQPAQNAGYTQQPQVTSDQQLIDLYGYDAALVMKQREQSIINQVNNTQFQSLYSTEEMKGKMKFGDNWDNHNYVDANGQQRNRVVDFRCCVNPITGQTPTLEQAWHALNPVDPEAVKQQAIDAAHASIDNKDQQTPAQPSSAAPQATGAGHATTVDAAFEQALAE